MQRQGSFSQAEYAGKKKQTRRDKFLAEMERVVPWARLVERLRPFYPKGDRGRPPIGLERMLRIHFLQQWYGLADGAMEDALYDSQALRGFAGIDLTEAGVPEETTILNLDFPLGLEGLLTNPGTPGGKDGGEANPTELHEGVQGAGGEAAAGRRQGAVGGSDGAWHWPRAAQPMAHRAPGGRLGRGTGRPQGGAAETQRLKREVKRLEEEVEILRKAAAFF